jgi:hypothetical protein
MFLVFNDIEHNGHLQQIIVIQILKLQPRLSNKKQKGNNRALYHQFV